MQYPVRPCTMSYDSAEVIASKVKNKQQQVEITLALNTKSTNYDDSKGTEIMVLFYMRDVQRLQSSRANPA